MCSSGEDTECDSDITSSNESNEESITAPVRNIHNNMTMTTVISAMSPQKVISTRTLPQRVNNIHGFGGTKFGTGRLFSNPLDNSRPDIIYHHPYHYDVDFRSDNVYETISHCKNVKNSVI